MSKWSRTWPLGAIVCGYAMTWAACNRVQDVTTLVDPFIGTGGHGHTYPGATVPFGMVQLSPDTRQEGWDGCSGYHFSDDLIHGFSHTHLSGTGVSDYADILLYPIGRKLTPEIHLDEKGLGLPDAFYSFPKADESAGPGWYTVSSAHDGMKVELTATAHCGFHRYTFGKHSERSEILLDLNYRDQTLQNGLRIVNDRQIQGFRTSSAWARDQRVFFAMEFSEPFHCPLPDQGHFPQGALLPADTLVAFDFCGNPKRLLVKVGLSSTSIEQARKNLEAEIPGWDFDQVKTAAIEAWRQQLGKIEVTGGTLEQQRNFYTALYHTSIVPNLFSDVAGSYRGMDGTVHQSSHPQYTVFSLWDTYRAAHPLYTLVEQKRTADFIRTFLRMYQEGGRLPVWELAGNETECMIGYHSVSVIADAYLKGIRGFDPNLALEAMVYSADLDHFGLSFYKSQGYIGAGDEAESVSKTLEYAYDDWCIAQMAHALGRDSIATRFYHRAQYYKNLFDPHTGFFRAKMNGCWQEPFDPREVNFNFTEANAWQYSLAVQQDIEGLMALMGGKKALEDHLDRLFSASSATTGREQADITGLIGQYAHGNEPSHHMAWLYNFTDAPHKTSQRVHQILREMYHDRPDGLSGNEDCGQMSAWYVMAAMGLYPVTPGQPEYHLCAPLFPSTRIHMENGNTFEITAQGVDAGKEYIHAAKLNGQPFHSLVIDHATLLQGGKLEYQMGATPLPDRNTLTWAGPDPRRPRSGIAAPPIAPVPYFTARSQTFTDTLTVAIASVLPGATIHYTRDGSTPTTASPVYGAPILLEQPTLLRAIALHPHGQQSPPAQAQFVQIDGSRTITLLTRYENQYAAGGDQALIDGLRGGLNFRTGRWQGYQGDMELVIDLGKQAQFRSVQIGFLQDIRAWIWMPREVDVSLSMDGHRFEGLGAVKPHTADQDYDVRMEQFDFVAAKPIPCRYIKVKATNYGHCPPWHIGAGGKAWIFADEVVVEMGPH